MWTSSQLALAFLMVLTGSLNTLAMQYTNLKIARGCYASDWYPGQYYHNGSLRPTSEEHIFRHPFIQTSTMFFGEFICLCVFKVIVFICTKAHLDQDQKPDFIRGDQNVNPLIFYLPALCDLCAESLMFVGFVLTYAASFQMFRGSVVIFTGLLSMYYLKHRMHMYKWVGMVLVLTGLVILGVGDLFSTLTTGYTTQGIIIGDCLIVIAQLVVAFQLVIEEKIIVGQNVAPLEAVGWEGLYGMCTLSTLLVPMYFIKWNGAPFEDSIDAACQITHSASLASSLISLSLSIAFFNFAALSITKELSATTRIVLDSLRAVFVWVVSLILKQQAFHPISIVGVVVLLLGVCVYNDILFVPLMIKQGWIKDSSIKDASNPEPVAPAAAQTAEAVPQYAKQLTDAKKAIVESVLKVKKKPAGEPAIPSKSKSVMRSKRVKATKSAQRSETKKGLRGVRAVKSAKSRKVAKSSISSKERLGEVSVSPQLQGPTTLSPSKGSDSSSLSQNSSLSSGLDEPPSV